MNTTYLPTLEHSTGDNPDAAVIWLHGLGADGHDFEPIVPELHLPQECAIRFIFPHAPQRPVTLNAGYIMPAWYDIYSLEFDSREDETGIRDSAAAIEDLITRECERGVDSQRIILAGFSQGGVIALFTGLRHTQTLGGIMALSTYLPLQAQLEQERSLANRSTPVFMAHGTQDPVVAYGHGDDSRQRLLQWQQPLEWHDYPMAHSLCPEEIRDIRDWLITRLA